MRCCKQQQLSPGNAFQIPDLWAPPKFIYDVTNNESLLFSEIKFQDDKNQFLPQYQNLPHQFFFSIPKSLEIPISSPSLALDYTTDLSQLSDDTQKCREEDDDLWLSTEKYPSKLTFFKSWDPLDNVLDDQTTSPYITEANTVIFDTVIGAHEDYLSVANDDYLLINSSMFSHSLLLVGLGRNSMLFTWDEERHTFTQAIRKLRISGFAGETLVGLTEIFLECGIMVKSLQRYSERCYSEETSPTRIALANSVNILLRTLELQLSTSSSKQKSILHLKALFEPAHSILHCFQKLINNTATNRSDESLLSTIFEDIQILEHRTDSLRNILLQILDIVSKPWLRLASEWLGLQPETGLSMFPDSKRNSSNRPAKRSLTNAQGSQRTQTDYLLDLDRIPSFLAPDDARTLFEVGKSLRLLKSHHPQHPLVRADSIKAINPPNLSWNFSCEEIIQVEGIALRYEKNIKDIIKQVSCCPKTDIFMHKEHPSGIDYLSIGLFQKLLIDLQADIESSNSLLKQPLTYERTQGDLSMYLHRFLTNDDENKDGQNCAFSPPISLIAALSFNPIIAAQARVVNRVCMEILFNSHQLRDHLSLLKDFQLFGDGVFSSKLTYTISEPGLRNAQYSNFLGLNISDMNSWPPATSELQLALMEILNECYFDSRFPGKNFCTENKMRMNLPGGLSFTIRNKSQEEKFKCMNPDGLEAFDFLRISYQPPPPLEAVITPLILYKYDELFKFLLRLNRMNYSISNLYHDNLTWGFRRQDIDPKIRLFRMEAHHFVSCVSEYFFNTGVKATWQIFDAKLNQIETQICKNEDLDLGQNEGLDKLRDYHERIVDRIMHTLLLKKRQRPVLTLLEDIFRLILEFSNLHREGYQESTKLKSEQSINEIYTAFSKKIKVFIAVLRGLSEEKGHGGRRRYEDKDQPYKNVFDCDELVEENTVIQILTRLESSGYYEKCVKS